MFFIKKITDLQNLHWACLGEPPNIEDGIGVIEVDTEENGDLQEDHPDGGEQDCGEKPKQDHAWAGRVHNKGGIAAVHQNQLQGCERDDDQHHAREGLVGATHEEDGQGEEGVDRGGAVEDQQEHPQGSGRVCVEENEQYHAWVGLGQSCIYCRKELVHMCKEDGQEEIKSKWLLENEDLANVSMLPPEKCYNMERIRMNRKIEEEKKNEERLRKLSRAKELSMRWELSRLCREYIKTHGGDWENRRISEMDRKEKEEREEERTARFKMIEEKKRNLKRKIQTKDIEEKLKELNREGEDTRVFRQEDENRRKELKDFKMNLWKKHGRQQLEKIPQEGEKRDFGNI